MSLEAHKILHATFIMERHLGHQVLYQNLRQFIDGSERVKATWIPVTYREEDGYWKYFPLLPQGLRGSLIGRRQVQRGLQVNPCEILYFNTQVPAALCNPQATGLPYLLATDITPLQYDRIAFAYGHNTDSRGPLGWYKHLINTRLLRKAARLLPWSSWTAESMVKDYGVDPQRVEVMPVGVDLEAWRPVSRSTHRAVRILFVGGDFERKGGKLLLEAFRSLPERSAELVLVTRTAVPPEQGVTVYNHILPNSLELKSLYQESDLFVLPSNAEAFGISAVEACASGLPVIATNTGGLAEIVLDQATGFLVPVGDFESMASKLRILVENVELRGQMGWAARRRAESLFDARKNAARLIELMLETILQAE
jgi:glycosyltransferase involved in cell wall biosynthesis